MKSTLIANIAFFALTLAAAFPSPVIADVRGKPEAGQKPSAEEFKLVHEFQKLRRHFLKQSGQKPPTPEAMQSFNRKDFFKQSPEVRLAKLKDGILLLQSAPSERDSDSVKRFLADNAEAIFSIPRAKHHNRAEQRHHSDQNRDR